MNDFEVRGIVRDDGAQAYICTCLQSRLRWRVPYALLNDNRRAVRAWKGIRQANWRLGLHGHAANHALMSFSEH